MKALLEGSGRVLCMSWETQTVGQNTLPAAATVTGAEHVSCWRMGCSASRQRKTHLPVEELELAYVGRPADRVQELPVPAAVGGVPEVAMDGDPSLPARDEAIAESCDVLTRRLGPRHEGGGPPRMPTIMRDVGSHDYMACSGWTHLHRQIACPCAHEYWSVRDLGDAPLDA